MDALAADAAISGCMFQYQQFASCAVAELDSAICDVKWLYPSEAC